MQISKYDRGIWKDILFKDDKEKEAFIKYLCLLNIPHTLQAWRSPEPNLFAFSDSYPMRNYMRAVPEAFQIINDFNKLMNNANN